MESHSIDDSKIDEIMILMATLSDDQRREIIRSFCVGCGSLDTSCQCWNDE